MIKKPRKTLSGLLQEVDIKDLQEPRIEVVEVKPTQPAKKAEHKISTAKTEQTILDKLREEQPPKVTRITIDLDQETYASLKQLVSYSGKTQAKLIRALIIETAKLLQ